NVELILRRLGRGLFAELGSLLCGCRLVRCGLFGVFRSRGLKLFWDLSKRRDKLHIRPPRLAEHFSPAVGSPLALPLDVRILEVVRLDSTDRAEVLVLKRAVRHLAAKNVAVFVERNDQCAAELTEPGIKVGLLIFGMILFGEHQHHRRLIAEWLAPM